MRKKSCYFYSLYEAIFVVYHFVERMEISYHTRNLTLSLAYVNIMELEIINCTI